MTTQKRHDSLIPLSREHHYGLMLCLRIHRGLQAHGHDSAWLEKKRQQAVRFFQSEMLAHFEAEEEVLFPAMRSLPGAVQIVDQLVSEHRKLEEAIERLREVQEGAVAAALNAFADLLESHIRREERALFPIYERRAPKEVARTVGERIAARIGTGAQPKNQDLLV